MSAVRMNYEQPRGLLTAASFNPYSPRLSQLTKKKKKLKHVVAGNPPGNNGFLVYATDSNGDSKFIGAFASKKKALEVAKKYRSGEVYAAKSSGLSEMIQVNPKYHYPSTERGRPRGPGRPTKLKALPERIFPGLTKGRPRTPAFWKADLYAADGFLDSILGQGTKQTAMAEAASFVGKPFNTPNGKVKIARVELNGPYASLDDMEADITEDDVPQVIREKKPRGRPRIHPIQPVIEGPKRPRGRPKGSFAKKHAVSMDEMMSALRKSSTSDLVNILDNRAPSKVGAPIAPEVMAAAVVLTERQGVPASLTPKKRGRPRKAATLVTDESSELARFNPYSPKYLVGGVY
jgi:hypothetical protein